MLKRIEREEPCAQQEANPNARQRALREVEKHKTTIVDRCHDGSSSRRKADVWREIADEFNAQSEDSCTRDMRQLRKCWENMKTRFRKLNPNCADAPSAMLQEGETVKSVFTDFGPTSLTPKMNQRIDTLIAAKSEPSATPFVDSILQKMSVTSSSSLPTSHADDNHQPVVDAGVTSQTTATVSSSSAARGEQPEEDSAAQRDGSARIPCSSDSSLRAQEIARPSSDESKATGGASFSNAIAVLAPSLNANPVPTSRIGAGGKTHMSHTRADRLKKHPFVKRLRPNQQQGSAVRHLLGGSRQVWSGTRPMNGHAGGVMHDNEKTLRTRYLRARIRDQEVRTRANIQKIRHANERHEAILLVLRRRAAHYEAMTERLRGLLDSADAGPMDVAGIEDNDDFEEDELMWDVLQ